MIGCIRLTYPETASVSPQLSNQWLLGKIYLQSSVVSSIVLLKDTLTGSLSKASPNFLPSA